MSVKKTSLEPQTLKLRGEPAPQIQIRSGLRLGGDCNVNYWRKEYNYWRKLADQMGCS
jgi:hypothetical protein